MEGREGEKGGRKGRRKGVLRLMPSILAGAAGVSVAKGKERGRKEGWREYLLYPSRSSSNENGQMRRYSSHRFRPICNNASLA